MIVIFVGIFVWNCAHATTINTGTLNNTTTAGSLQTASSSITPSSTIRFDVAGAKFTGSATPLSVTITVDAATPAILSGSAADQKFRDDSVSASFFGYYLSTAVRSASQTNTGINIKIQKGAGETSGRSFYLLGNGTTTPTAQSNLTAAPASATTFVSTTRNAIRCGPSYSSNGISSAVDCAAGSTVTNMDLTQFVKVAYSDPTSSAVVSELQFTAVCE